jgi:ABC-type antimicrobial peptide transport system permease subunit
MALKVALGGDPQALARDVVLRGLLLAAAGMGAGLALSMATLPLVRGILFGVTSTGPGTYGVALGLMAGVVAVASYLPTRRATRLDPIHILNSD